MLKRAAIYIRVSTDEQAKHGFSLGEQRADLEQYAKNHGYAIYDVYADEGNTARKAVSKRKELQRLLDDVRAGNIDVIILKCLDRWFRNVRDYYKVQEVLDSHNVQWECTQEEYNTTTTNGRLMLNLKLSIAQNESDQTSDRIKYINQGKYRRKEEVTGKHPYGYATINKKLAIVPEERPIVEFIFNQILAGSSTHSIAGKVLAEFGISMAAKRVWRILRNPTYKGERYGIPDFCPAIISPADFDNVQEILSRNNQPSRTGIPYYFNGKIKCPSCGNILVVNCGKNKKTGEYSRPIYICGNRYVSGKPHEAGGCQFGGGISESVIEKYLISNLPNLLAAHTLELQAQTAQHGIDAKARIKHLNERLNRLKELYLDGLIDKDTYKTDYAAINLQISDAFRQSAQQRKPPRAIRMIMEDDTFDETYAALDRQHKKELWQSIIKCITIIRRPDEKGKPYKDFRVEFL